MKNLYIFFSVLVGFGFFFQLNAQQDSLQQKYLKLYYQCESRCYSQFIKENLQFTEFVRDPHFADVHLIVSSERAGNGGRRYKLRFFVNNQEANALQFHTIPDQTDEEIRKTLLKYITIGLSPYWAQKGLGEKIKVEILADNQTKHIQDKWNNWIINTGIRGNAFGSEVSKYFTIGFNINAKQVKKEHKTLLGASYDISRRNIFFNDELKKYRYDSYVLKYIQAWSINEKWSWAVVNNTGASTFSNYKFFFKSGAGLEYDVYPYDISFKKLWTFGTILGVVYNKYFEKTVFNKTEETLLRYELYSNVQLTRKWGSVSGTVSYRVFTHDPSLYSLNFYFSSNLRLYKGLSFNIFSSYDILHNQINLPATGSTLEDILLQQKEIKTGYRFSVFMGLNFSFGSMYNTIVNPRFDF